MIIDDQIKDEKLQNNINREAAKIYALSSGEIRKYEYLTGEDTLPSNQQQIIEQAKITYSPLGKASDKQTKTINDQGEKQVEALNNLKPDNKKISIKKCAYYNKERFEKIINLHRDLKRDDLIYRSKGNTSD